MSRISIQYSIESEEFESEMLRLINNSVKKLTDTANKLRTLSSEFEKENALFTSETTANLTLIRQRIADVDFNLGDAVNIIGGYVNYQLEAQMAAANAPTEMSNNYARGNEAESTPEMYEHEFDEQPLNPFSRNTASEMTQNIDAFEKLVNKITTMDDEELSKFRGFTPEDLNEKFNQMKETPESGE
jgi:ElaB/YqjD/DUF883 family membrane-anchored ribosome-binding protein